MIECLDKNLDQLVLDYNRFCHIALIHLKYAYELGVWYYNEFSKEHNFVPPNFQLPLKRLDEVTKDQEQLKTELIQRKDLEKLCQDQQARLEEMQQNTTEQIQETIDRTLATESLTQMLKENPLPVADLNSLFTIYCFCQSGMIPLSVLFSRFWLYCSEQ